MAAAGSLSMASPLWAPRRVSRTTWVSRPVRVAAPRAAVVEASPRCPPPARETGAVPLSVAVAERAEDILAESKAMARAANATVYSAELLALRYGPRPFKVVGRALEVLTALGSFGLKLLIDKSNSKIDENKRKRGAELRRIFTRLGPTFVKIGQGLSTRPDICPPEYLEELSELQDALPTFPDTEAFACIEKELGVSLDSIYSSISQSPIAAASLGQVYKAQLS